MNRADTFNRANQSGLGSPSDGGSAWAQNGHSFAIDGNAARLASGTYASATLDAATADAEVSLVVAARAAGAHFGLVLRASDDSNYLAAVFTFNGTVAGGGLFRRDAGTYVNIDGWVADFDAGDTLTFRGEGNALVVKINGTTVLTSSSSFNATETKHGLYFGLDNATRVDSFTLTDLSASPLIETGATGPFNPNAPDYDPDDYLTPDFGGFEWFSEAPAGSVLGELVRRIDGDTVSPYNAAVMAFYQPGEWLSHAGVSFNNVSFVSNGNNEAYSGMPLNVVDSSTDTLLPLLYRDMSDEYPRFDAQAVDLIHSDPLGNAIPPDARVQGWVGTVPPDSYDPVGSSTDLHIGVFDRATYRVCEAYHAFKDPVRGWVASNGFSYDARTGAWLPQVETDDPRYVPPGQDRYPAPLVTAAGLPFLPLSIRWDEIYSAGVIKHAIGVTLNNLQLAGMFAWPAIGIAYTNRSNRDGLFGMAVPYGARFRLNADWYHANVRDESGDLATGPDTPAGGWGTFALVVLRAMKEYGLIVTDGGLHFDTWIVQDSRWGTVWNTEIAQINGFPLRRLEVVEWEEDLLEVTITPETAEPDVERTVTITNRLWERHPSAHPGDPTITNTVEGDDSPKHWPWAYFVRLNDPITQLEFGARESGTPGTTIPAWALMTPEEPTAVIKVTPGIENKYFYLLTAPYVLPYPYGQGMPCLKTNDSPVALTVTPDPATVAAGGTLQFSATLTGTGQDAVSWSSTFGDNPGNGWLPAIGGASGLLSAWWTGEPTSGVVTARSVADPFTSVQVAVTVGDAEPEPPSVGGSGGLSRRKRLLWSRRVL
jgi:hypothetical protein